MNRACVLCDSPLATGYVSDGGHAFCCTGCMAVYNVLSRKGELAGYQESSLFRQAVNAGLISNPHLLERLRKTQESFAGEATQKLHLEITDLWCPSCAEVIRLILLQERGIVNCVVDYFTDMASIEYAPRLIEKERLFEAICQLGYHAVPLEDGAMRRVGVALWLRFVVAAFCALNLMMFAYPIYTSYFNEDSLGYDRLFTWISLAGALPVVFYSAWPLYKRFLSSFRVGILGMEALVVMGIAAAFVYSTYETLTGGTRVYFDSMAVIVAFVLLGKMIETRGKFSAKESLMRLTHALPRRGRKRLMDGSEVFVVLKEIVPGDFAVALTGEKIVLDGVVSEGEGLVDESLISGEPLPAVKHPGSLVMAGTLLRQGRLVYRVTATPEQSLLHQMIGMVERDWGHKASSTRVADRIANWFVPVVMVLAAISAGSVWLMGHAAVGKSLMETALLRGLSVLLISCPCAIGIAAPLAESYLMQGLAQLGAIVRNRRCLAFLGCETVFVFDKTGTVTMGTFSLLSGLESLPKGEYSALKGLTAHSIHPIACAINREISELPAVFHSVEEIAGRGLCGVHDGNRYLLGSLALLEAQEVSVSSIFEPLPVLASAVYFVRNGQLLTTLVLGDSIRPEAAETVAALAPIRCCLLSGDGVLSVERVVKACGFSEGYGGFSPLEKRAFIDALREKGEVVAMLGDGINDTLALTAAHVGISVVSATDVSIQVSDILLTTDKLTVVPRLCALARHGRKIVKQNLFWAFAYNVVGIGLALYGLLSPIFAAFAMAASSLIVLVNAQRCRGFCKSLCKLPIQDHFS